MHDGLQALNTIVEASKTAGDRVKVYCEDKCKDLQDKLLYAEVYQRRENLRFFGIGEKPGSKEDTLAVLQEFFVRVLAIQPEEVLKIESQRVHRVDKINVDGRPRAIIARFLRYQDREFIFTKTNLLKDSQFGISADLPQEIVKRRKAQVKKLIEARRSGSLLFSVGRSLISFILTEFWYRYELTLAFASEFWLSCYLRSFPIVF